MKNFQNYKAEKYADTEKYVEAEEGIYRIKDPSGQGEVYVTSLSFELEDDNFEGGCSPQDIPQTPFEDLLDEFMVYVTDFYEAENEASEVTCYQEFGSPELEDIQNLRTIIGKRFYAYNDPENEDCYLTKIEDETAIHDPQSDPGANADDAADDPEDEDSSIINIEGETDPNDFEYEDFENGSVIITRYRGEDKEVTIPAEIDGKPVRAIGGRAFADCGELESVVISEGVEEIYWDAFKDCKKLKNIVFPESVTSIMGGAFKNTSWLRKQRAKNPVVIVNGIVVDGKSCKGDVVIPEGVREITSDAFESGKLTSVVIPEGVTVIGHRAFQVCKALTSVTMPGSIKMIGEWAFEDCKKLENINFPDGVEELGDIAFNGTPWLENKRKEAPLVIFGTHLYDGRGCKGDVEIPDGITHICYHAFYYNRELTSVKFPESVTMIDRYAFQGCSALKNVKLVYGLTKISEGAFSGCSALEEIDFPRTVAEIEEGAFRNCESLKEVNLPNEELTMIASGTFQGCTSLDHIYIYDCVTKIEESAFEKCTSMRWVRFPDGLKAISKGCFRDCTSLEKLTLLDELEVIERDAFRGCTALQDVGFPDSVTEIGVAAFMDCTALEKVYLSEGLTEISNYTFANCTALEKVRFEDGLKAIGTSAFHGCKALEEIDLPDTMEEISDLAFAFCYSLEEVEIPAGVKSLDPEAFRSCTCTITYKGDEPSFSMELTTSVDSLNNEDNIVVDIFGRATEVVVISTGDNQFDKNGQHKPDGFALSEKEIAVLNDFLENVKLADFIKEITDYFNERYEENGEELIDEEDTPYELKINTIAVNVCKENGEDDPEIAFMGDCYCDDEGGICIGFREGKLVGIEQQDWLL